METSILTALRRLVVSRYCLRYSRFDNSGSVGEPLTEPLTEPVLISPDSTCKCMMSDACVRRRLFTMAQPLLSLWLTLGITNRDHGCAIGLSYWEAGCSPWA